MNKAFFVAAGIFLSRVAGLIRTRAFAYYFGLQSEAADAFNVAFRIPNVLQNLFGEGALSGSFIPVYAGLLARGDRREADRVAGAVAGLLSLMVAVLVLAGVLATPWLIALIAPGFSGAQRTLTIQLVRILFPGAGLLVLSAWCLGVLNSHHRFLLSYAAPVMWNAAMIASLVMFGGSSTLPELATVLAWGSVAGSALQFLVQIPIVLNVAPGLGLAVDLASQHVRTVLRNFVPVLISRGVVQISSYVDSLLATLLPTGAVTGLTNAQLLYTLPISLFGMSVAAVELPAMAGASQTGGEEALRRRLQGGLKRMAFFVVPSAVAFLAFGDVIAAALLQTGRFRREDAVYVWGILAGSALGLLASTAGRLYSSAYYALHDTRTPLRCAVVRVGLGTMMGYLFALPLPRAIGVTAAWGAAGLTTAGAIAGWIEMGLLRRGIHRRVGRTEIDSGYLTKLWLAASLGAALGWGIKLVAPSTLHPIVEAGIILTPFLAIYLGTTSLFGIPIPLRDVRAD